MKLRFYEELSLDSAVRKKLRTTSRLHLPSGLSPLSYQDLAVYPDIDWEPIQAPWPRDQAEKFAVSIGHIFTDEQKQKFLTTRQLSDCIDLNAPADQFDFSILACRPRHYNSLHFGAEDVTKTCSWKEKGLAEVAFFRAVPDSLQHYYPKVISSTLTEKRFVYTMTHLKRFELGRLSLEGTLSVHDWSIFYGQLSDYFDRLSTRKVGTQEVQERLKKLFIHKLHDRMEALKQFPGFDDLASKFKAEVGASFDSRVKDLSARLETIISSTQSDEVVFSHGDMSFCNILYDVETQKIGLVDPRGKDPVEGCFRPIQYDLAKLSHSALGNYEAIVMGLGLFNSEDRVKNAFLEFIKKFSLPLAHLRSYEASLFWSLLPLHLESPSHLLHFMNAGEQAYQAGRA